MNRSFFALILILSILGELATGAYLPLTPLIVAGLDLSISTTQASVASFLLTFAFAQILLGPLSDRIGRRPVVLGGLAMFVLGSAIAVFAQDGATLIIARAVQGIGAASGYVVGRAMLRDFSDAATLPPRMSVMMLAFAGAILSAPVLGSAIVLTDNWRLLFVVSGVFAASVLAWSLLTLEETPQDLGGRADLTAGSIIGGYAAVFRDRAYAGYVFTHSFGYGSLYTFLSAFPLVAADVYGLPPAAAGPWLTLTFMGFVVGLISARFLTARLGAHGCIALGVVLIAANGILLLSSRLIDDMSLCALVSCQLVLMIGFSMAGALAQDNGAVRTPSGDQAPIPAVRLLDVDTTSFGRTRTFFGRVTARKTVNLSFEVGGRLTDFSVPEGTRLMKGDVVARLDAAPFERALRRAELNLEQARRELRRAERLAQTNAGSAARSEDAATAADLAEVALADISANLEDTVLVAPFDALVSRRIGTEFSNITAGQPIVSLHDMSEVRVEIDVPERVFFSVADRSAIVLEGDLPNGERTALSLGEFEAQTGAIGQSFRVALVIPPENASTLIPGASMTVYTTLPPEDVGAALPPSAILSTSDRAFEVMVFVPTSGDQGRVERRSIELGAPGGTSFRALGLNDSEQFVAAGAHLLTEGQTVRRYDGLIVEEK